MEYSCVQFVLCEVCRLRSGEILHRVIICAFCLVLVRDVFWGFHATGVPYTGAFLFRVAFMGAAGGPRTAMDDRWCEQCQWGGELSTRQA